MNMSKQLKIFKSIVNKINEETKEIEVLVSAGSVDRDMEIVKPEAVMKNISTYMAHPILLSSHSSYFTLQNQIGEAKEIKIAGNGIVALFKYYADEGNPEADWAWNLAKKGIAAFSIGFIAKAWEDKNAQTDGVRRVYTDIELMEISQVLIPANRDAVQSRRSINDAENELCELAVKAFDSNTLVAPQVKQKTVKQEAVKQEETPKHYSDSLLDPGSSVTKTETDIEEDEKEILNQIKNITKESF